MGCVCAGEQSGSGLPPPCFSSCVVVLVDAFFLSRDFVTFVESQTLKVRVKHKQTLRYRFAFEPFSHIRISRTVSSLSLSQYSQNSIYRDYGLSLR